MVCRLFLLAYGFVLLSSCGSISAGSVSSNDPAPSGSIVAQGNFVGLNGKAVTGSVAIYNLASGSFVVRLIGISVPAENGLQVAVVINGGVQQILSTLRSYTGTQNYSYSAGGVVDWTNVSIHSPMANADYGMAILQ